MASHCKDPLARRSLDSLSSTETMVLTLTKYLLEPIVNKIGCEEPHGSSMLLDGRLEKCLPGRVLPNAKSLKSKPGCVVPDAPAEPPAPLLDAVRSFQSSFGLLG